MSDYNDNVDIVSSDSDFEIPINARQTIKKLWRSVGDQRGRLTAVLLSVFVYVLLSMISPMYSAYIVDRLWMDVKEAAEHGAIFRISLDACGRDILFLLLIYAVTAAFYTLQSFLMAGFAEKLNLRLRTEISEKLNKLPLSYFDRTKTGDILSRLINDLDKTSEVLQTGALKFFISIGLIAGSLVMMLRLSVALTIIFLIFMALALAATKFVSAKTLRFSKLRQQRVSEATAQVEEAYTGRVVIKAFNLEDNSYKNMSQAMDALADAHLKAEFFINAINPAIRLINRFGQVFIAVLAGNMLIEGRLSAGMFQAFLQYLNQASEPFTEAAYMINSIQAALASLERIYDMLEEEEISPEPASPSVINRAFGSVEFQNVRFGYTPDNILMRNVVFAVEPGQKVAIVGSTGAGKTTLINLLMRFYELNGGKILLDGIDIKTMTRSNLRDNLGMVLQDTWLFDGTVAENIAYGKPEASKEEIIAAAKAARADFFIRAMSNGYDTVLTNDSENVSIGQRQLLTIARAFLRDPALIILDEATSSVDTRTEIEIGRAMKELMKNRTSFVIAHRLSTIIDADLILLMQNGNIIEQGTHKTLLKAKGAYADLYYSQFA